MKVEVKNIKTGKVQSIDNRLVPLFEKGGKWERMGQIETRDIVAETEDNEEISEITGKPKRKYKRRDLQAEE